jgi:hypothetical protein
MFCIWHCILKIEFRMSRWMVFVAGFGGCVLLWSTYVKNFCICLLLVVLFLITLHVSLTSHNQYFPHLNCIRVLSHLSVTRVSQSGTPECSNTLTLFRRVCKIAKIDYRFRHVCLPICPSVCLSVCMKQLGFHWTDFCEIFYIWVFFFKNCRENSSFIKIWQE